MFPLSDTLNGVHALAQIDADTHEKDNGLVHIVRFGDTVTLTYKQIRELYQLVYPEAVCTPNGLATPEFAKMTPEEIAAYNDKFATSDILQ